MNIISAIKEYIYRRPRAIFSLYKHKELIAADSYYPEYPFHSSIWENWRYQAMQILRYGQPNKYFFMYGLDSIHRNEREQYVNYWRFRNRRMYLNIWNKEYSSICLLRNKLYFALFAESIGIRTPKVFAYFDHGQFYIVNRGLHLSKIEELTHWDNQTLFCKELEGECGLGIFKLTIEEHRILMNGQVISTLELQDKLKSGSYIIQESIVQHIEMSRLYPYSINTIRLVTVRSLKDHQIHIMPSILRIGANGNFVDNTSQGGIAIGFDLHSGQLHEYGFYKPEYGKRATEHPNTHVVFKDFYIPFIQEAEHMAISFHCQLKDIHSIGWDIAITENGAMFVEGNDNWEINGPQVGNQGFIKEFKEYF